VERELVFDIDMTDYDDIRTCCDGANICHKCWPFMTMALKVIDRALREDFGFKNIVWIYSGRRGIHCWVCDPVARALKNDERSAIVTYLSMETGPSENSSKAAKKLHPMIVRAYEILEPYFEKYICSEHGQKLLVSKKKFVPLLNSLPDEDIRAFLYKLWDKDEENNPATTGVDRWKQLKDATTNSSGATDLMNEKKRARVDYPKLEAWRVKLVLKYCYPRLDANVSKQQNHLLKSPFCVHPKTGRVCLPINPANADEFDPFSVPTLRLLCAQIDSYDGPVDVDDLEKTDMKKALEIFDEAFMHDMRSTNRKDLRETMDKHAAYSKEIDF
jgi:DNA primase small subunit